MSSASNPWTQAHVVISGKVQGVGYRVSTWKMATRLGLQGWVRNLPDSRVEAVFVGPASIVAEMLHWCHQGPPTAVVRDVMVEYSDPAPYEGFEIR